MTPPKTPFDPAAFWLAVVDARHVRLFHGSRTAAGRLHLDEVSRLEEEGAGKQHSRPTPSTKEGRSFQGIDHVAEEQAHRFAKSVAQWAGEQVRQRKAERLHLFAPKQILGVLRAAMPASLHPLVREEGHDLGRLTAGELAEHPAVLAIPVADERAEFDAHLKPKR